MFHIPRRARYNDGTPITPMRLGQLRADGIKTVMAYCARCQHGAAVDASPFPDETFVPDVGLRLRCSRCGSKEVYTQPNWMEKKDRPGTP